MTWNLEVVEGPDRGARAAFSGSEISIGRDSARCGLTLSDQDVSRLHARALLLEDGAVQLEDMGSANGTLVNGARIEHPVSLGPEDSVQLGGSRLRLTWSAGAEEAQKQPLAVSSVSIGSLASNDLAIDHPDVSRHHARLDRYAGGMSYLTDLNSSSGTFVNGQPVRGSVELSPNSWIRIGPLNYHFDGEKLQSEEGVALAVLRGAGKGEQAPLPTQLAQAFRVPFAGGIPLKLLLGSVLAVIPVVNFFAEGYRYRLLKDSIAEKMEMPAWDDWKTLFVKGLLLYLLKILYILVPVVLTAVFFLLTVTRLAAGGFGLLETGLLLSLCLLLLTAFLLPMGWSHFAATGEFASAFQFRVILQCIKSVLPQYLAVLLLVLGLWIINAFIALIPAAGWIISMFLSFFIQVVSVLLFGILYRTAAAGPVS